MKMTDRFPLILLLTTVVMLFCTSLAAVDDIGKFEMDGDAMQDTNNPPDGDDWDTLFGGSTSPVVFTGIKPDPAPESIFEGGKKDILDIPMWRWKTGSVPDKDDITHAYAAAYHCPDLGPSGDCDEGDLVAYFGADRLSNSGDAFLGFWFFRGAVSANDDGSFTGQHVAADDNQVGDVLILVNFPQASNADPEIRVVNWDPMCRKEDKNLDPHPNPLPAPGDNCAAKNLQLLYDGIVCGEPWPDPSGDNACAITNDGTVEAPWEFESKNPDSASTYTWHFPYESFFEGGINLTRLVSGLGGNTCFASFMAETRSSSSFTSTLKDFSLDEFPLCAVELSKACNTGTYESGNLVIPYTVTVTNTGSALVDQVVATDDVCGFGTPAVLTFGPLAADESQTLGGDCIIPPGLIDYTVYNGVTALASDDVPVFLADSCIEDADQAGTCFAECSFDTSPSLAVEKYCDTRLVAEDGVVKVKVEFWGSVENTSDETEFPVPLEDVQVWDNNGSDSYVQPLTLTNTTSSQTATSIYLEPGEIATFSDSYLPDGTGLGWSECPQSASFSDQVEATGVDVYTGNLVGPEYGPATCTLCETGNCDTN